ncbi:MAG: sterol carrier protein domain-containing protein, partial [Aquihabitans sp.]
FVVDAHDRPGEVDGYAVYRMTPGSPVADYAVTVSEVVADTADQHRALWRVVGSSGSQAPDVNVAGPAEDPLFLILGGAEPTSVQREIRWMLRLVDVAGAVAARGWNPAASGCVHLQVEDQYASWNDGRWVLEVAGGEGRLTPGGDGTVGVGIGGLSSWWSGYASARTLLRTGHLESTDQVALSVLDGLGAASPPSLVDVY